MVADTPVLLVTIPAVLGYEDNGILDALVSGMLNWQLLLAQVRLASLITGIVYKETLAVGLVSLFYCL